MASQPMDLSALLGHRFDSIRPFLWAKLVCDFSTPKPTYWNDLVSDHGRPRSSSEEDDNNNGIYISIGAMENALVNTPPRIKILWTNRQIRNEAMEVMLKTAQFIRIKSTGGPSLMPFMAAARVPVLWTDSMAQKFPADWPMMTHEIKWAPADPAIRSHSLLSRCPWGMGYSMSVFKLMSANYMYFHAIILRQDLDRFLRGLEGADSGFHDFGCKTIHTLNILPQFSQFRYPNMLRTDTHRNAENILKLYRNNLSGFENISFSRPPETKLQRHECLLETELQKDVREHQRLCPHDLLADLRKRMRLGQRHLDQGRRCKAAETFTQGWQHFWWLWQRGRGRGLLNTVKAVGGKDFAVLLGTTYSDFLFASVDAWCDEVEMLDRLGKTVGYQKNADQDDKEVLAVPKTEVYDDDSRNWEFERRRLLESAWTAARQALSDSTAQIGSYNGERMEVDANRMARASCRMARTERLQGSPDRVVQRHLEEALSVGPNDGAVFQHHLEKALSVGPNDGAVFRHHLEKALSVGPIDGAVLDEWTREYGLFLDMRQPGDRRQPIFFN